MAISKRLIQVAMNILPTCLPLFLIFLKFDGSISQIYTSTHYLEKLSQEEGRLVAALTAYVETSKKNHTAVSENVLSFLETVKKLRCSNKDDSWWAEHPINSYHLIKRIVFDWPEVYSAIWCETCSPTYAAMDFNISLLIAKREIIFWPTHHDLEGAIGGIFRLWRIYNLDINDLINGKIENNHTEPLTTADVMRCTRYADDRKMFYEEILWLENLIHRRKKINMDEKNPERVNTSIIMALAGAYYKYGMPWKSLALLERILNKDDKGLMNNHKFYSERLKSIPLHKRTKTLRDRKKDLVHRRYESLCRGNIKGDIKYVECEAGDGYSSGTNELTSSWFRGPRVNLILTMKQISTLHCFIRKWRNSYLTIKEEVINKKPRIMMFHDVLYPTEAEFLRLEGVEKFERSTTYKDNIKERESFENEYRISQSGWLKDTDHPILMKLSRRISSITGLDTTFREHHSSAERYQVVNYGVGGMYRPHTDNLIHPYLGIKVESSEEVLYSGERLATWMFYLTTPEAGGATVFPLVKARARAVMGSALFWYNTYPDGKLDSRVLHAGCPVLLGSKWVANKWIRQYGNELKKPCGLTDDAEFQYQ